MIMNLVSKPLVKTMYWKILDLFKIKTLVRESVTIEKIK